MSGDPDSVPPGVKDICSSCGAYIFYGQGVFCSLCEHTIEGDDDGQDLVEQLRAAITSLEGVISQQQATIAEQAARIVDQQMVVDTFVNRWNQYMLRLNDEVARLQTMVGE